MITLYKNADKSIQVWTIKAVEGGFEITSKRNLSAKSFTKFHPVVPKNVGRSNETSIEQQTALEIGSRVKKQKDKGYVDTIEEASSPATNTLNLLPPMLAKVYSKESHKINFKAGVYVQPKLDGHRALYKDGVLYSRGGKVINLPHIVEALNELGTDLHLDGEIYYHGKSLQEIGSLVKKPREESKILKFYIYDVILDLPYYFRGLTIKKLFDGLDENLHSNLCYLDTVEVFDEQSLNSVHKANMDSKFEGSIVRHSNSGYVSGKRSDSLLKVKDFDDAEFLVTGMREGISIVEGLKLPVFTCVTKDGLEFEVTCHGNAYEKDANFDMANIGRYLTVKYFGFSDSGIPLLPVALRWREDV